MDRTPRVWLTSPRRAPLLVALVVAAVSVAAWLAQPRTFVASARVAITATAGQAGAQQLADAAQGFAGLATSVVVLAPVATSMNDGQDVNALARVVSSSVAPDRTSVIVSVTGRDPQQAALLAEAVADELVDAIPLYDGGLGVAARVAVPATVPTAPSGPDPWWGAAVAALAGVLAGAVAWLFGRRGGVPLQSPAALERATTLRNLGRLTLPTTIATRSVVQALPPALDASRGLVALTAAAVGQGKSRSAVMVAKGLRKGGANVLLVDTDLSNPHVHQVLGIPRDPGLTFVLLGRGDLTDVVSRVDGLDVLTAGTNPPNPAELLASAAMREVLDEACSRYDVVVVDGPPVDSDDGAHALRSLRCRVVLVARVGAVTARQLRSALARLGGPDPAALQGLLVFEQAPDAAVEGS